MPVKRLGIALEVIRLAGQGDVSISLDPYRLDLVQSFLHRPPDRFGTAQPSHALEGLVHLQEAIVHRCAFTIADYLVDRRAVGHPLEETAVPRFASPQFFLGRRHRLIPCADLVQLPAQYQLGFGQILVGLEEFSIPLFHFLIGLAFPNGGLDPMLKLDVHRRGQPALLKIRIGPVVQRFDDHLFPSFAGEENVDLDVPRPFQELLGQEA